jgi:hypothetical protein
MRDRTRRKVDAQTHRREAAERGSAGRLAHKGGAGSSNKGRGGKMAR